MDQKKLTFLLTSVIPMLLLSACQGTNSKSEGETNEGAVTLVETTTEAKTLATDLSAIKYEGDYYFDEFLNSGGANSDSGVVDFLQTQLGNDLIGLNFSDSAFGCSTLAVTDPDSHHWLGRNFDWQESNIQIVETNPTAGFRSVSTVNLDFLNGYEEILALLPQEVAAVPAIYAPLDGINERGLAVAVLMIEDNSVIQQQTEKPDLTTTTVVRLLLDQAANVPEALTLLAQYDVNSSMGLMVHFALADSEGNSVVVEFIDNEMQVIDTPIATNFYLAEGEKQGVGSQQSHSRFDSLEQQLAEEPIMDRDRLRDAMDSVSKDNYDEFLSTEWTVLYDLTTASAEYFHRENYEDSYQFSLSGKE